MQELESPAASLAARYEAMPEAKRRVHAAALECFARYGRAGARIDEIVRNSKVNVRMIYHYYGSKDGLYDGILAEVYQSRTSFLRGVKTDSGNWSPQLLFKAILAWQASEPTLSRILDWDACEEWQGSSAAVEEECEAPEELAPEEWQGNIRDLMRRAHILTSPWARLLRASLDCAGEREPCIELLVEETAKCFAAESK